MLDLSAQPVPGAAGTLTNRQPGVVIVARAPPVWGSVHRVVSYIRFTRTLSAEPFRAFG